MIHIQRFVLFVLMLFLISCGGDYLVKETIDKSKGNSVFIEKFSGDKFNMKERLEYKFAKMGFNPIESKEKSDYTLKWRYAHAIFGTNVSVRLINSDGVVVYLGEGDNPGFGTLLNPTGSIWGCFERALAGLENVEE